MNPTHILGTLVIWTFVSSAVLMFAWIATMVAKKHASLRHLVWVTAFAALILIPVASTFVPARFVLGEKAVAKPSEITLTSSPMSMEDTSTVGFDEGAIPPVLTEKAFDWKPIASTALVVWSLGLFAILAKVMAGLFQAQAMRRSSLPASANATMTQKLPRRKLDVRVSLYRRPPSALTWGTLKPVVILPQDSVEWPAEKLETVMLHEIAHVHRFDSLTQLLALAVCAFYWFNPLVWLAARALRADAEIAADDAVVQSGISPAAYAAELLRIATEFGRQRQPLTTIGVSLMKQSQIETRILSIVDPANRRRGVAKLEGLSVLALGAMAAVALVSLRPAIANAQDVKPPVPPLVVSKPTQVLPPLVSSDEVPIAIPPQVSPPKQLKVPNKGKKEKNGAHARSRDIAPNILVLPPLVNQDTSPIAKGERLMVVPSIAQDGKKGDAPLEPFLTTLTPQNVKGKRLSSQKLYKVKPGTLYLRSSGTTGDVLYQRTSGTLQVVRSTPTQGHILNRAKTGTMLVKPVAPAKSIILNPSKTQLTRSIDLVSTNTGSVVGTSMLSINVKQEDAQEAKRKQENELSRVRQELDVARAEMKVDEKRKLDMEAQLKKLEAELAAKQKSSVTKKSRRKLTQKQKKELALHQNTFNKAAAIQLYLKIKLEQAERKVDWREKGNAEAKLQVEKALQDKVRAEQEARRIEEEARNKANKDDEAKKKGG